MSKTITLYSYTNRESGKRYIGATNNPTLRHAMHANAMSGALSFNRAVKKHGIEAFDYKVLALFDDVVAAAYHEQAAILIFHTISPDGYNLRAGAPFTIYNGTHTAESRTKISVAKKGCKWTTERYASQARRGRIGHKHTAETRAKISAFLTGRTLTTETRAKIAAARKGCKHTAASLAKMSAVHMGNKNRLGHTLTAETRAKISAASMGHICTAETRAKISAAAICRKNGQSA